jgi:hypothetical protein
MHMSTTEFEAGYELREMDRYCFVVCGRVS